jgi:phenylalanyl-tRNA synthetase beta subunit
LRIAGPRRWRTDAWQRFQEISRFPAIRRDLAFVLPQAGGRGRDLRCGPRTAAGALLQEMTLFDVYQGQGIESGRKSVALVQVQTALNDKFGATLRE